MILGEVGRVRMIRRLRDVIVGTRRVGDGGRGEELEVVMRKLRRLEED